MRRVGSSSRHRWGRRAREQPAPSRTRAGRVRWTAFRPAAGHAAACPWRSWSMRHIPQNPFEGGRPLASMRDWSAPNLVVFSRAPRPPVASLVSQPEGAPGGLEDEETPAGEAEVSSAKSELRGMSAKSSLNLARVLSSLDWTALGHCLHCTLTYHRGYPGSKTELASAKSALTARLGGLVEAGIWRLEYQSRTKPNPHKVPHWHVLAWCGQRDPGEVADRIRYWWNGYSGNSHERATRFTLGDQARGTWYLAMHAAKREQSPLFRVGRWWGYLNRARLLSCQDLREVGEVTERERVWWARLYRRATGARTRSNCGFSWFLPRAAQQAVRMWVRERVDYEKATRGFGGAPY